ncbi:MAG: hypothetical protein BRD33_02765, partial [Bacteroidetes bacterium QH_6_63_17]
MFDGRPVAREWTAARPKYGTGKPAVASPFGSVQLCAPLRLNVRKLLLHDADLAAFQHHLDLARALMTAPRLLLLDEIMAGLNPGEKDRMVETVGHLQTEYDLAVLVIEHDLAVIRSLCDRIVVIDEGHNLAEGTATEIFEDERV